MKRIIDIGCIAVMVGAVGIIVGQCYSDKVLAVGFLVFILGAVVAIGARYRNDMPPSGRFQLLVKRK